MSKIRTTATTVLVISATAAAFGLASTAEAQMSRHELAGPGEIYDTVKGVVSGKLQVSTDDPVMKGIKPTPKPQRGVVFDKRNGLVVDSRGGKRVTSPSAGLPGKQSIATGGYTRPSAGLPKSPASPSGYTRPSAGLPKPGGLAPKYPNYGHGKPGDFDNGKRPGQSGHQGPRGHHGHHGKGKHRS